MHASCADIDGGSTLVRYSHIAMNAFWAENSVHTKQGYAITGYVISSW